MRIVVECNDMSSILNVVNAINENCEDVKVTLEYGGQKNESRDVFDH